jgi:hypothetical protein
VAISCAGRGKFLQRPLQDLVFGPAIVFFQRQIYKKNKQNASFFLFFTEKQPKMLGFEFLN